MNKGWQRILSTTMAILFVMSSALVCAPTIVVSAEGHCKPSPGAKAGCSHCPQKNVMDCCATSAPQPSSVPQDTASAQQNGRSASTGSPVLAELVATPPAIRPPAVARIVRGAPLHGYRSTDLPILNAVFLI